MRGAFGLYPVARTYLNINIICDSILVRITLKRIHYMAKFELIGIEMSTKVSVIPTSTKLCVKAVKAQNAHDRICDELHSLLHEPSWSEEMKDFVKGLLSDLSVINDFIQPIVNALENEDEDDENYPAS